MIRKKQTEKPSEWDPPAPSTVYIKIKNIPYETFKTRLNQGLVTTDLDQIRYRLEKHIYCCGVCSKHVNGYCVITNRKAEPGWICKSFVPKEEFIYLDSRPDRKDPTEFRYLSETGLEKDYIESAGARERRHGNEGTKALYDEGVTLYRQGRLKLALEAFDSVLEANPLDFAALFHKGNALLKLKRYEEALEVFERASEINQENAGLWTNLGFIFTKLERFRDSLEAFEKSISLNPVQKNAWEGRDAVIARVRLCEERLRESEEALKKNPEDPDTLFKIGKIHLRLGEQEKAIQAFKKALEIKPENAEAWQFRGKVLFKAGSEKEALHAFEKATRLKPDYAEAWFEKGNAFHLKGAENAFKIAARLWDSKGIKSKAESARDKVKRLHSSN
ncbi:GTP cyclohydrolase III (methanopterin) [Methanosarcina mazei Tuc01]|uniref:GTP cyclohydrolase III (Methanopterin) n=1 Tax=Methanosarcina mazei Tuc01 TaxID=1236903 RepID=M1QN85_METMZ|nr:tetratricopeptide repeat protein [Methanosarcina mazei]AGF98459.1 GTP cyclohydrolase III (methanopterin) [Methanosarcina mazei Tuc01]